MLRCERCLGAGVNDVAPTPACIRRAVAYLDFNKTLMYSIFDFHSELQKIRTHCHLRALQTNVETLLRKRRAIDSLTTSNSSTANKPFLCPDLMPGLRVLADVPGFVERYLTTVHWNSTSPGRHKKRGRFLDSGSRYLLNYMLRFTKTRCTDSGIVYLGIEQGELICRLEDLSKVTDRYGQHFFLNEVWKLTQRVISFSCKDEMLQSHAEAECFAFTRLIHKYNVPREIRDMSQYFRL